jgi:4-hydroxybenzoate polyprenyltransferase
MAREALWGRRGLLKVNTIWLPIAVLLAEKPAGDAPSLAALAAIALVVITWIFLSTLTNDLSECGQDSAAGKQRWICATPPLVAYGIVMALPVGGWTILIVSPSPSGAKWAYGLAALFGVIYSLKPLRLKERGLWAIAAYSLSCSLAYAVLPWAWLKSIGTAIIFLWAAVFCDKWVNLHFHQVIDREADTGGGIRTYAVRASLEKARRSLRWSAGAASAALLALFLYIILAFPDERALIGFAAGIFAAGWAVYILRDDVRQTGNHALLRELPWHYLGLTLFVLRILAVILWAILALKTQSLWPAFAVVTVATAAETWLSFRYRYH